MRYAIGPGSGWNHPLAPTENRRGHHPKHPAHPIVVEFQLPTATALLLLLGSLLRVSFKVALTPAPEKQWWLWRGVCRSRSDRIISPLFGETLRHQLLTDPASAQTTIWCKTRARSSVQQRSRDRSVSLIVPVRSTANPNTPPT